MHRSMLSLVVGLVSGFLIAFVGFGYGRARAVESFELGEHDHIIAEAPGCHVECRILGGYKRTCMVRDYDCKAVCMDLPECNTAGRGVPKVCAIMRTTR